MFGVYKIIKHNKYINLKQYNNTRWVQLIYVINNTNLGTYRDTYKVKLTVNCKNKDEIQHKIKYI